MRDAVLLAAGEGKRLDPLTQHQPKPLIKLLGKPLLAHVLERLQVTGIKRVIIITGYKHEQIEKFLTQHPDWGFGIVTVFNENYERGNGDSLLCAEQFVEDRFLLAMADHLVDPRIYLKVAAHEGLGLCVDKNATLLAAGPQPQNQLAEATKVWIEEDRILQIGKHLNVWNGIDVGVFSMTTLIFEALHSLEREKAVTLTSAVSRLIERGNAFSALDVSGMFWCDIDTPLELKIAEEKLRCKL